jgi:hypothetical protein
VIVPRGFGVKNHQSAATAWPAHKSSATANARFTVYSTTTNRGEMTLLVPRPVQESCTVPDTCA